MRQIEIIDAPSILELFPRGVERLADALREQGLAGLLGERAHRCVDPLPNTAGVDPGTGIATRPASLTTPLNSAAGVGQTVAAATFALVLGGDCSILLGRGLGSSRAGFALAVTVSSGRSSIPPISSTLRTVGCAVW